MSFDEDPKDDIDPIQEAYDQGIQEGLRRAIHAGAVPLTREDVRAAVQRHLQVDFLMDVILDELFGKEQIEEPGT